MLLTSCYYWTEPWRSYFLDLFVKVQTCLGKTLFISYFDRNKIKTLMGPRLNTLFLIVIAVAMPRCKQGSWGQESNLVLNLRVREICIL